MLTAAQVYVLGVAAVVQCSEGAYIRKVPSWFRAFHVVKYDVQLRLKGTDSVIIQHIKPLYSITVLIKF